MSLNVSGQHIQLKNFANYVILADSIKEIPSEII